MNDYGGFLEGMGPVVWVVWLAFMVFYLYCGWKLFEKAGQPGWGIIIPIYNLYLMMLIAKRPGWWVLLFFIPIVNIVIGIVVTFDIARQFGKDALYGLGLLFFGFIFFPVLALGSAKYKK